MKRLLVLTLLFMVTGTHLFAKTATAKQPAMVLTDIQGKIHKITGTEEGLEIEGLKGKIVFLEFFGHRCPPCLASIPHLIKLQKEHKDKLAVIAIEVQGLNNAQLQVFAKEKGINYTVIADEKAGNFVNYIAQRAQWRGSIPFMLALDTKGTVQFVQAGMLPESSLEALVKQLSAKTPAAVTKTK